MMGRVSLASIGISCIAGILLISPLKAQVVESFSDGNITSNPPWTGDTSQFEVNTSKQLHLKSSGTDSAGIVTTSHLLDSTEWMLWVKLSFSASSNNYCRIYLSSDNADLMQPLNGFYLQLGEAGSSDAIELFRQEGTQHFSVCRGKEGYIAASFSIRIKVKRSMTGKWTLFADSTGGNVFLEQATGMDSTPVNPQYFGIYCRYTNSNASKFYFDDLIVRHIQLDLEPPLLSSVKVPDVNHLELLFNEALDQASLTDSLNYMVDQGQGPPTSILYTPSGLYKIVLYYSQPFLPRQNYHIQISGIKDLAGNQIIDTIASFLYYKAEAYDIVINEIMADPEPQVGLPPVEYLEIFNTSDFPIVLDNWILAIGSSIKTIPSFTLAQQSYLIISDSTYRPFFPSTLPFLGFPTFSLANDGTTISLLNHEKQLIHSLTYSSDWYHDPLKAAGGWSLEQIDPHNPCGGKNNWKASINNAGGTPGLINSVRAGNTDNKSPFPEYISVTDPSKISVHFNESLDSSSLKGISSFSIEPGNLQPEGIQYHKPDYSSLDLDLPISMEKGVQYHLLFLDTIRDCAGNTLVGGYSLPYGLPEEAKTGEVVINEILFDPDTDVPEFFEIYNTSNKIIGLNSLLFADLDSITLSIGTKHQLTADCRLLFPYEYLAFTVDPDALSLHYQTNNPSGILMMPGFPSLANTGGCLSLVNWQNQLIDTVIYRDNMHYPLLTTTKGVSLERINPYTSGMKPENWHSASSTSGYATPAMRNSQSIEGYISPEDITLEPPIFSPDNDGYHDLLQIQLKLGKAGYLANISIFNTAGQPVRKIACNALLGNEDVFIWDGIDDQGYKSPIGMYILFFEFFNTSGEVKQLKKVAVLGGRL